MNTMTQFNQYVQLLGASLIAKAIQENDTRALQSLKKNVQSTTELAIKFIEHKYSFEQWRAATFEALNESVFNELDKSGRFAHYVRLMQMVNLRDYYQEEVAPTYLLPVDDAKVIAALAIDGVDILLNNCYQNRRASMRLVG